MDISLSILNSNFYNLKEELESLNDYIKMVHLDVMDGHFVKNLSFGNIFVESIKNSVNLMLDVHLMIDNLDDSIDEYIKIKPNYITFHIESTTNPEFIIKKIKSSGIGVGITFKPNYNYKNIVKYLDDIDLVLIMSVDPGYGGQPFIEDTFSKIKYFNNLRLENKYNYILSVDGGINKNISKKLYGIADMVVVGSYITKSNEKIKRCREIINNE